MYRIRYDAIPPVYDNRSINITIDRPCFDDIFCVMFLCIDEDCILYTVLTRHTRVHSV